MAVLLAAPVHAQTDQVRRGPAPAWITRSPLMDTPQNATGAVFVRRQDVEVRLGDTGQTQYLGYRFKILQPSALQLGNISIVWNPRSGAPTVHQIRLHRGDEVIDVLKTASFEILRREGQLEAAMLDGMLTAVLRIPDVRVGDEIDVELTTFISDPTLGADAAGVLFLTPAPPPGRYHLGLSWEKGRTPTLKTSADLAPAMATGDQGIDFRFDNPAVLSPPKDAPPRYRWQRMMQFTSFADWAAMSRRFAPLYAKASALDSGSAVQREARRIAAAQSRPMDRAAAALKLVQQDVRYIYVGLNGGNLTPASAEETWQRRYGDCKGKTVLLLALLRELGIEAEPVLVNSAGADDGFDQRLPIPQLFDHVLVRARIDGATYWLDGTLPPVATASASPLYPLTWVLPLTARGSNLEKLEWRPAATPDEISLYEIDAREGFDKPARIVSTHIVRGVKGLQEQVQFSAVSQPQMPASLRQTAIGGTWQAIDDVQWRYDPRARASILTISGTGKVDWDDDAGGGKSLALPGGGFNPPERRARGPDQDQDTPFYTKPEYSCHVTTVRLPLSTQPQQWSSKPSFDTHMFGRNYYRAWELRDGAIRMVRGSRIEQPEIDAATARRDNDRIAAFDNSMGWIFYHPGRKKTAVGAGETVPATYDFDWTADDAPCIPKATQAR